MENLFKFLHILAVIVWVGGVLTVNVLQVLTGRGHDRAAQGSLLGLSDLYGRAIIAPAAALTLLTGLVRVEQIDVGYGTFWVAWGIAAIVLSLALGATLIRVTNAELRRMRGAAAADDQRARAPTAPPALPHAAAAGDDPLRHQPAPAALGRLGHGIQANPVTGPLNRGSWAVPLHPKAYPKRLLSRTSMATTRAHRAPRRRRPKE